MDTNALVENLIDDGRRLVDQLPQEGFEVAAAFWLQATENGKWYFYIVSPVVDLDGLAKAYRQLHPLVRAMPQPFQIDPLKITLIGPNNPIAKDVLQIQSRAKGHEVCPIRWNGNRLGNISVEDAYVYPLPATTP